MRRKVAGMDCHRTEQRSGYQSSTGEAGLLGSSPPPPPASHHPHPYPHPTPGAWGVRGTLLEAIYRVASHFHCQPVTLWHAGIVTIEIDPDHATKPKIMVMKNGK